MFYEFKRGHNTMEAAKNISCTKDDSTVDHCLKNICLGSKNFDNQARSGRFKTVDIEAVL